MYQWVETARYKYEHTVVISAWGRGGNMVKLYMGCMRRYCFEQIGFGNQRVHWRTAGNRRCLRQSVVPEIISILPRAHLFTPSTSCTDFSVTVIAFFTVLCKGNYTDCAGESSGSKANWNLSNLHFRVEIVKCKAIYCNFTFRSLREKVWVANL